jgi:iron complex outermembrane receptor protein
VTPLRLLFLALGCAAAGSAFPQEPPSPERGDEPVRIEEEITVSAGHSDRRIEDAPLRVEVVNREDIEEKALVTPGSVAMLLAETTGLRVQTTAPTTGAANVRIQGLRGRYTLLLSDGLPLHGAEGSSLSLLQVPPLDLGQVEIIKGAASALYGPSALAGVVNLVSQQPTDEPLRQALVNASTQEAADATAWLVGAPHGEWAGSLLAGLHGQLRQDPDRDGWSDLPSFARGVVRPRAFWNDGAGHSLFLTAGAMAENRDGGTEEGHAAPDGQPFAQDLDSRTADAGLVGRFAFGRGLLLSLRGAFTWRQERRVFGGVLERGSRTGGFGEAVLGKTAGRHTWLVGTAVQVDSYDARDLPALDYAFTSPGLFIQDELRLGSKGALGISARVDRHSEYGTLASPRASFLYRPTGAWTARVSAGTGFFAPTPFLEETEETGLSRLEPPSGLVAERGRSASADVGWKAGRFEVDATAFVSRVEKAAQRRRVAPGAFAVVNADLPVRTWGLELLARYRTPGFTLLLTHSYTSSTEENPEAPGARREVPLTPDHVVSLNAIWERATWSLGLEAYYTGRQALDQNPYRARGRAYLLVGALLQRSFGRLRAFVNLENVGNVRQTQWEPLLLPTRAEDGRWTVDVWAPLDGFVANAGLRVAF